MRRLQRPPFNRLPENLIDVTVDGLELCALVNTGVTASVIRSDICQRLRKVQTPLPDHLLFRSADNLCLHASGVCTARVAIQGYTYHIQFLVLPRCSHDVILGWDFLRSAEAVIDFAQSELWLQGPWDLSEDDTERNCNLSVIQDTVVPPESMVLLQLFRAPSVTETAIIHL